MKRYWVAAAVVCACMVFGAVQAQDKVQFTKNLDLITETLDQRSIEVAKWLQENLTQAQVDAFEAAFFPPLTDEQRLQAAKIERNMAELQGKDTTAVKAEIEELKTRLEVAPAVEPLPAPVKGVALEK